MRRTAVAVLAVTVVVLAAPLLAAQLSQYLTRGAGEPGRETARTSGKDDAIEVGVSETWPAPSVMTRDQFSRIQSGMTYAQCLAIVGVEGEPADTSHPGHGGETKAFRWQEPSGPNEFVLGFRDGRLASKSMDMSDSARKKADATLRAQRAKEVSIGTSEVQRLEDAALKAGHAVVITLGEFNRLRIGMTYDECAAIIGAEHPMARGYAEQRNAALQGQMRFSESLKWQNPGGYFAETAFENGRMTRKEWKKTSGPSGGGSVSGSSRNAP